MAYLKELDLAKNQMVKLNKLRVATGNTSLSFSNQFKTGLRQHEISK